MEKRRLIFSIRIYISKLQNIITFKIKTGYYLELLTPGTMKLHGSNKSMITKNETAKNVPILEITKVVLRHFNIVNKILNKLLTESCIHLFQRSHLVIY